MPTPFMHLALAHRLKEDPALPGNVRNLMTSAWGAFLLGSIAPDARVSSGLDRVNTHFFQYQAVIDPHPVNAMLTRYPSLCRNAIQDSAQAAFLAGYVGHLTMDVVWCTDLLFPHFFSEWATIRTRMKLFTMLLATLDQRDRETLSDRDHRDLMSAIPDHWLPFMGDSDLAVWRDTVAVQLAPGGESQSLRILSKAIKLELEELTASLESEAQMAALQERISAEQVAEIENKMYSAVRDALEKYANDTF